MPGESWEIKEPKEMGFFNEVYEVYTSSIRTEPHGKEVIRWPEIR
jgi:hypothetical protein